MGSVSRAVGISLGLLACVSFFALSRTAPGLRITFLPPWTNSSAGELLFWLGATVLLTPGAFLVGWCIAPWLGPRLRRGFDRVQALERREQLAGLAIPCIVAFALAVLGRDVFLRGLPITDDEQWARFGGQILARGQVAIEQPEAFSALAWVGLLVRDGMVASFDWLGAQLGWAIAEWTGLGSALFALAAAVPVGAVGYVVGRRLGPAWGAVGAGLLLISPMAATLSWTTHAHLLSRAWLAVALCLIAVDEEDARLGGYRPVLLGLVLGASFLCRPVETAVLACPLVVLELVRARRRGQLGRTLGGLVAGGALPLALLGAHNAAVTGQLWVTPRAALGALRQDPAFSPPLAFLTQADVFWERLGVNLGLGAVRLAVWFLGPLGLVLVVAGVSVNRLTRALAVGVALILGIGLLHDDPGVHIVGPIHFSECAVFLAIVATFGLHRLVEIGRAKGLAVRSAVSGLVVALVAGLGIFVVHHGQALRRMTGIQEEVYGFFEESIHEPAVIVAPRFYQVWLTVPRFAAVGSWVLHWRYPHPDLSDPILIARDRPEVGPMLRAAFPDRTLFRLQLARQQPYLRLGPLEQAEPGRPGAPSAVPSGAGAAAQRAPALSPSWATMGLDPSGASSTSP